MKKATCKEDDADPYRVPVYHLQLVQDGTAEISPMVGPAEVAGVMLAPDGSHWSFRDHQPDCLEG